MQFSAISEACNPRELQISPPRPSIHNLLIIRPLQHCLSLQSNPDLKDLSRIALLSEYSMMPSSRGRRRENSLSNRSQESHRERGQDSADIGKGKGSSKPYLGQKLNETASFVTELENQLAIVDMTSRRDAARARQQAEARLPSSQERQDQIDVENFAMDLTDIPLDGSIIQDPDTTHFRRNRAPQLHSALDVGVTSDRASRTLDKSSSRQTCRLPVSQGSSEDDDREGDCDSEYEFLMHSDVWSDTEKVQRAGRSRLPPPFRDNSTQTQEDNRPTTLKFEDETTFDVDSDPEAHGDTVCPIDKDWDFWMPRDTPQETYRFEVDYPSAAPLLRKIIALPHNTKVELMAKMTARSWRQLAAGLDKAVRLGRFVIDEAALNAQELREVAGEGVLEWAPGLFEAMWNMATGPFVAGNGDV